MAENIKRKGYGQVEPNHLSGIVEGRIYAQLPAATVTTTTTGEGASAVTTTTVTPIAQLEQGQFAKYDYAAGVVNNLCLYIMRKNYMMKENKIIKILYIEHQILQMEKYIQD